MSYQRVHDANKAECHCQGRARQHLLLLLSPLPQCLIRLCMMQTKLNATVRQASVTFERKNEVSFVTFCSVPNQHVFDTGKAAWHCQERTSQHLL